MKTKDYILYASLIVNLILGYWIYDMTKNDQKPNEDLFKSQGRVEILENQLLEKDSVFNVLEFKKDSIDLLLAVKPKERVVIKVKYYEKANDVINVSTDSSISILARRLSEINIDR
jgi:hypothetical protein